jgi:hypothetical protein
MKWQITVIGALALVPAMALAQEKDTTTRDTSRVESAEEGRLVPPEERAKSMGLSTDQARQLEQAIKDNGCDVGTVDGIIDSDTHDGLACIRRQKNIQGNDLNDVLKALNLGFTVSDTTTVQETDSGALYRDTTRMKHDSSMMKHDSSMMKHDSSMMQHDSSSWPHKPLRR